MDDDAGCVEHRAQGCGRTRATAASRAGSTWPGASSPRRAWSWVCRTSSRITRPLRRVPAAPDGRQRQQIVGARNQAARVDLVHSPSSSAVARRWLAEADGNRTRQAEILGLTGFEDRGDHQDPDATVVQSSDRHGGYASGVNETERLRNSRRRRRCPAHRLCPRWRLRLQDPARANSKKRSRGLDRPTRRGRAGRSRRRRRRSSRPGARRPRGALHRRLLHSRRRRCL